MRYIPILTVLYLCSCSPKIVPGASDLQRQDSTRLVYIEKPVPVPVPGDSAAVEALLRCDEHGEVLLQSLHQEASRNSQLQFSLDSLGRLLASFQTQPDTIYVPAAEKESVSEHIEQSSETDTVEVPAELTGLQKFLMRFGAAALVLLTAWFIYKVRGWIRR